jgi:hypothetical protein
LPYIDYFRLRAILPDAQNREKALSLRKAYFQKVVSLTVKIHLRIKVEQLDTLLFAILTINYDLFLTSFFSVDHIHTLINVVDTPENTMCEGNISSFYAIITLYYIALL